MNESGAVVPDRSGLGVVVQDTSGRIVDCNEAATRILGRSQEHLLGDSSQDGDWDAIHLDGSPFPGQWHPAMMALRTGVPIRDVLMGVGRPQGRVWLLVSAQPQDGGVVVRFLDITAEMDSAHERLRATVDSMLDPHLLCVAVRDESGEIVDVAVSEANEVALDFIQQPRDAVVGVTFGSVDQPSAQAVGDWVRGVLQTGEPLLLDAVPLGTRYLDVRAVQVGEFVSLTWRDVTDRILSAKRLAQSEQLFRTAMQAAVTGMAINDLHGRFTVVNDAMCNILGRTREELLGMRLQDCATPGLLRQARQQYKRLLQDPSAQARLTGQVIRGDGALIWVALGSASIPDAEGRPNAFLSQVEDISGERAAREQLAYQAFHDPLTGLRNRSWMLDMLSAELRIAVDCGRHVGVLFIDLDNFKVVNDSLGHAAGDEVLKAVAGRIKRVLGPRDHAARFGGDEFVVLVPEVEDARETEHVADLIGTAVAEELIVHNHPLIPTASIGIAVSTPGSTAESLLRDADAALFSAKDAGRARWHFFDENMHAQAVARMSLEAQMRQALEADEFIVHYQPIVRLADSTVVGHEALVRWQHRDRGLLSAVEFIPVAEASGLIVPLGEAVLRQVVTLIQQRPDVHGPISVNVSAMQLSMPGWIETFLDIIADVDPRRLVLEVTETAVLSLGDTTASDLQRLRSLGIGIHVDDFGTGFSSISLLRELPVTGLKLDVSFTRNLTQSDSPSNALARGLAGLALGLHLQTIAEGVETQEQAALLEGQGWVFGQGYRFGKPEPI